MKVTLLNHTPLSVCVTAIRTCWDSHDKGGCYKISTDDIDEKDIELIDRVGNKNKHSSTLEHLQYNFYIQGISRACLQELARHRMASFSVKSTRYTLKKRLKDEAEFITDYDRASKYIKISDNLNVAKSQLKMLDLLLENVKRNINNDNLKPLIPECFLTDLVFSINARSLQNFLTLRTSNQAYSEIRKLSLAIYDTIPHSHKFIFKDCIKESNVSSM